MSATRVGRFVATLRQFRSKRIPLTGGNVRAAWIQSDPDWLAKLPLLDLTDEEWDLWVRSMGRSGDAT